METELYEGTLSLLILSVLSRRRRYYQLTDKGRRALSEKKDSWKHLCRAVNQVVEKSNE